MLSKMMLCELRGVIRKCVWVLLVGIVIFSSSLGRASAASAVSDLLLLDFDFSLTPTEMVVPGPPVPDAFVVGNGELGPVGVMTNIPLGGISGPFDGSIRVVNLVVASAPPPDFSKAYQTLTVFFTFTNLSGSIIDIDVDWHADYFLSAAGNFSLAQIEAEVTLFDATVPLGPAIGPPILLFADAQSNDGGKLGEPSGAFKIHLAPFLSTDPFSVTLRAEASVTALAAIPEPSIRLLLGSGLAIFIGLAVCRTYLGIA